MADKEKVLHGLDSCGFYDGIPNICEVTECPYRGKKAYCVHELAHDAGMLISELLKAQEPVKPRLARGWYWCGGIGCRNSLTSALENDIPALKPNYCERCGRPVKWE